MWLVKLLIILLALWVSNYKVFWIFKAYFSEDPNYFTLFFLAWGNIALKWRKQKATYTFNPVLGRVTLKFCFFIKQFCMYLYKKLRTWKFNKPHRNSCCLNNIHIYSEYSIFSENSELFFLRKRYYFILLQGIR